MRKSFEESKPPKKRKKNKGINKNPKLNEKPNEGLSQEDEFRLGDFLDF